jgi:threonine dehydratase
VSRLRSTLRCQGCGYRAPLEERRPFLCPQTVAGDGIDHALRRELEVDDSEREPLAALFADPEPNPFLRYRELFHSYRMALAHGASDSEWVEVVERLDRAIAEQSGAGLRETPCLRHAPLAEALGCADVWVKDETVNFGGTHKGRHLAGLLIWLMLDERLAGTTAAARSRLAIASCGNAALAASIAARSVEWPIEVFVPTDANPVVVDRLQALDAGLRVCERRPGEAGDPCYLRFLERLEQGALPFTCQGPSNGLVIEGGQTLIWEMVSTLAANEGELDRLFIQTGGAALATACVTGWREAAQLGAAGSLPAIHAVQTEALAPLARAYDGLAARIAAIHLGDQPVGDLTARAELAAQIRDRVAPEAIAAELEYAAEHRSEFMWPWEGEAHSLADAILDDETYDWLPLVSGMLESGGYPIEVSEERLAEANELAVAATGIRPCDTGSTGLAGALRLESLGLLAGDERLGLLFTGVRRQVDS